MDSRHSSRPWSLERLIATLRQRHSTSRLVIVEDGPEQVVLQLDHVTITLTHQGMVEVAAPTNVWQRVEQLATEMEQFVSQATISETG